MKRERHNNKKRRPVICKIEMRKICACKTVRVPYAFFDEYHRREIRENQILAVHREGHQKKPYK